MGEAHAVKMRAESQAATREEIDRWVEQAQAGDQGAFEHLYRAHSDRIYALCWRLCGGDAALAEDLVQEAFVRAWNKLHLFRGDSAFGTTFRQCMQRTQLRLSTSSVSSSFSDSALVGQRVMILSMVCWRPFCAT